MKYVIPLYMDVCIICVYIYVRIFPSIGICVCLRDNIEQVLAATTHKAPTIRPPASNRENYPSQTNQTCRTLLEKQGRAHK